MELPASAFNEVDLKTLRVCLGGGGEGSGNECSKLACVWVRVRLGRCSWTSGYRCSRRMCGVLGACSMGTMLEGLEGALLWYIALKGSAQGSSMLACERLNGIDLECLSDGFLSLVRLKGIMTMRTT